MLKNIKKRYSLFINAIMCATILYLTMVAIVLTPEIMESKEIYYRRQLKYKKHDHIKCELCGAKAKEFYELPVKSKANIDRIMALCDLDKDLYADGKHDKLLIRKHLFFIIKR